MQQNIGKHEHKRLLKMALCEQRLYQQGYSSVAGLDEAGRGPLAGPVVAAACVLPEGFLLTHLNDSKRVRPEERDLLFDQLVNDSSVDYAIGVVSVERIDQINILRASLEAMKLAVHALKTPPTYLLVDGDHLPPIEIPGEALVRGDGRSLSIAAASILAKVTRDRLMVQEAEKWPRYCFAQNKGYATLEHLTALHRYGPCPIHRRSFEPIKTMTQPQLSLF
jgi:ribonuclease HII